MYLQTLQRVQADLAQSQESVFRLEQTLADRPGTSAEMARLERESSEKKEKLESLERMLRELEMENKHLKGLLTDQGAAAAERMRELESRLMEMQSAADGA